MQQSVGIPAPRKRCTAANIKFSVWQGLPRVNGLINTTALMLPAVGIQALLACKWTHACVLDKLLQVAGVYHIP